MTLTEFIAKWRAATLTERAAAQQHFLDLCDVLGQPKPAEDDPTGERYAFEKGVLKTGGGSGFADVWRRGHFAWEYKGKRKNLGDAYRQLLAYREDLENPPLLVVCDLDRFEVHTNFTGTVKQVHAFGLGDLGENAPTSTCALPPLEVLRALFSDPERLRPTQTTASVTEQAAREFGKIAASLRARGAEPHDAARFLIRLLFCLFAEDVGLLPAGLFTQLVEKTQTRPDEFGRRLSVLFGAMAAGGAFGVDHLQDLLTHARLGSERRAVRPDRGVRRGGGVGGPHQTQERDRHRRENEDPSGVDLHDLDASKCWVMTSDIGIHSRELQSVVSNDLVYGHSVS